MTEREKHLKRYASGRSNLMIMSVFTLVNVLLLVLGGSLYFLFSASVPYFVAVFPWVMAEQNPSFTALILPLTLLAILMLVPYVLAFFLGKDPSKYGWLLAALILFGIDTVGFFVLDGLREDNAINLVFHIWVLVSLAMAVYSAIKLKDLPAEEVEGAVAERASESLPVEEHRDE